MFVFFISYNPDLNVPSHLQYIFHYMMTLETLCDPNTRVDGEFPHKGPVMQSFRVFFFISLKNLWNKQFKYQWFEMPLHSRDITDMIIMTDGKWAPCEIPWEFPGSGKAFTS